MKTRVYKNINCLVCGLETTCLSGRQKYCKPCYMVLLEQRARKWEKDNPERTKDLKRSNHQKHFEINKEKRKSYRREHLYGITPDRFEIMLADQDNKCAICKSHLDVPFVDHDHATKKVRELLCRFCNAFIGLAKEDSIILSNAIQYLQKHKETNAI